MQNHWFDSCLVIIIVLTLDAGLLARSQYPEGPATGHLDTGFSWFPYVYRRMLRWFPSLQVATTCFSCSPPDLNFLVTFFIFVYMILSFPKMLNFLLVHPVYLSYLQSIVACQVRCVVTEYQLLFSLMM